MVLALVLKQQKESKTLPKLSTTTRPNRFVVLPSFPSSPSWSNSLAQARDLARPPLIEVLTGKSGDAVNWLVDRFGLDLSEVSRLGGHSFERTHRGNSGTFPGYAITFAQMEALEELAETEGSRVEIRKKADVKRLLKEGDKVVGVEYEYKGELIKEYGPVVLATGESAFRLVRSQKRARFRFSTFYVEGWKLESSS